MENLETVFLSDIGERSSNEDAVTIREYENFVLAAVADGMGGYAAGEVASATALSALESSLPAAVTKKDLPCILASAVDRANEAVYRRGHARKDYTDMGTTLVASVLIDDLVVTTNVGDSRAYVYSSKGLDRITKDHSLVQQYVELGIISPEESRTHPQRHVLTQAIGIEKTITPDSYDNHLEPCDILLLCSDGLTDSLDDDAITKHLAGTTDLQKIGNRLVAEAKEKGATDNISVVLVRVSEPNTRAK